MECSGNLTIALAIIDTTDRVGIPLAGILDHHGNFANKGTRKGCPYDDNTTKEKTE
jgi:hypothetical protein